MADNKFFTNTYITNSGRQNYLRIDFLEDPLFTSFTFDIDFNSSPLFYTINSNYYGYPNVEGVAKGIETSLSAMHSKMVGSDKGYDILPLLSANFIGNKKLGFGLQQNVFIDEILYGATEYIYMVDKRNVSERQDDIKSAESVESVSENSSKPDNTVEDVVNDSDNEWAQKQTENTENTILECDDIMKESKEEHKRNAEEMEFALMECDKRETVDGKKMDESQLEEKVKEYNREVVRFETLKKDIIKLANVEISKFQTEIKNIYSFNDCVDAIYDMHALNDSIASIETKLKSVFPEYKEEIKLFAEECKQEYDWFVDHSIAEGFTGNTLIYDYQNTLKIRTKWLIDKFGGELEYFGLKEEGVDIIKGEVKVDLYKVVPLWATDNFINLLKELMGEYSEKLSDFNTWLVRPLSYICGDDSFVDFTSDKINEIYENLYKYETAFGNLRSEVYGVRDGVPCNKSNPTDDSPYGKYLAAKEKYENDAYSQAMNTQSVARSEVSETEPPKEDAPKLTVEEKKKEPVSSGSSAVIQESKTPADTPQTVLDMLGFISGMKKMILEYPYIINGITGLDKAYENNYGIKDPYMGSGDNKITLTCWESLDLRVSSMFNRYFNAIYDRQYRRERVPINLRRFNCSVYVHDVRNFGPKSMNSTDRIVELRDMYFSTIEFKFYDCEIVPEETGNIFNDISNEAPSEMKKTNFTFTYGNCVVNFIPAS